MLQQAATVQDPGTCIGPGKPWTVHGSGDPLRCESLTNDNPGWDSSPLARLSEAARRALARGVAQLQENTGGRGAGRVCR
jgi:hypothetical protein